MPKLRPIHAVVYQQALSHADRPSPTPPDLSDLIAPPYDVLDEEPKRRLLARHPRNIVQIDLPFTPPKSVGPDEVYHRAGDTYRSWLNDGTLTRLERPAYFVYRQTYTHQGRSLARLGLIADVAVQPFARPGPAGAEPARSHAAGSAANETAANAAGGAAGGGGASGGGGGGGIWAHENTFAGGKEDRLKLTRATRAQLSPIFGMYDDADRSATDLLRQQIDGRSPTCTAVTENDGVTHELWSVPSPEAIASITERFRDRSVYIADGHHRYNTALNYWNELQQTRGSALGEDHPAGYCMFVLVAVQDPGMIVLPTHRVLGGMGCFSFDAFRRVCQGRIKLAPFPGSDLSALEAALPAHSAAHHEAPTFGLYVPSLPPESRLFIASCVERDPLARSHPQRHESWRRLDVAILQHLVVEQICQQSFCPVAKAPTWKFPHTLESLLELADSPAFQLGVVMRPTPLESVIRVSHAGELMPQKSTFFFPKLATGLVIHPLD